MSPVVRDELAERGAMHVQTICMMMELGMKSRCWDVIALRDGKGCRRVSVPRPAGGLTW